LQKFKNKGTMKKMLLFVSAIVLYTSVLAQNKTTNSLDYKTAVGLRVGVGGGLNLKTFIQPNKNALEFTFFLGDGASRVVGLYEVHGDLSTEGNLKWYLGGGPSVMFVKNQSKSVLGINGVIGLDYKVKTLPINVALDWQPGFQIGSNYGFVNDWVTLAVRYTL
jgi:hypothetical protein